MSELIKFPETAIYRLLRVSIALRNLVERRMAKVGLHGGQVSALIELWKLDGISQSALAARLGIAPPTVNKILKGLTEINLVEYSENPADGRIRLVVLTNKGRSIRSEIEAEWVDAESDLLANLTETERLMLSELLDKLHRGMTGVKEDSEES